MTGSGGIQLKVDTRVFVAGLAIVVVLALIVVIGAACCACIFCVSTTPWWTTSTQTEHRTDTTVHAGAPNIELYVDTIGGDVVIEESAAATDVTISFDVHYPQGRMNDMQTETRSEQIDNATVRITATARHNAGYLATGSYGADVTVTVPKNASYVLDLHTLGGDITVPPLTGTSVRMDTLGGALDLNGGRYETVYMNTAGGNIRATYEATNVTLTTLGGNIDVDTTQTAGRLYANTMGGNINVVLPSNTLFTVDASTFGGRVRHGSIHLSPTTDTDSHLVGPTEGGAGNLTITLKTMGGNIDLGY